MRKINNDTKITNLVTKKFYFSVYVLTKSEQIQKTKKKKKQKKKQD